MFLQKKKKKNPISTVSFGDWGGGGGKATNVQARGKSKTACNALWKKYLLKDSAFDIETTHFTKQKFPIKKIVLSFVEKNDLQPMHPLPA